jgi:mannan endo-1,4-beta-mannosidase
VAVVAGPSVPAGFVTRRGTQLLLNGQPYRFSGLNIYNATNTGSCWYVMGSGARLDQALTAIGSGQRVFRAWFFQTMATTNGQRDWSAFDHTLAVARAHGERVIVTLANQWGDCEAANNKNESWYQRGYRTTVDPGMLRSYRAWVAEAVSRYRTNPTIMAWQLINEAEDAITIGGVCSATAGRSLRGFAQDMANVVKGIDRYHLLSLGTIGNHCGTIGADYPYVHSVPGIDLCEYHDYAGPSVALPGALQTRINQCRALNKPLFVGETGIQVQQAGSLSSRAAAFKAKFAAQFRAGVVGELVWDWRDGDQDAYSGYELGPGDPALGLFGLYR